MHENKIVFLYVTMPNLAKAYEIAEMLLKNKLSACANIIPAMTSIYEWEGEVKRDEEAILIVKTSERLAKAAEEMVADHHPYDTPCIVAFSSSQDGTHPPFAQWVNAATS